MTVGFPQYSITSVFALARFALTPQSPSSMNQTIIVGVFHRILSLGN